MQGNLLCEIAGRTVLDLGRGSGGKLAELVGAGAASVVDVDVSVNVLSEPPFGLKRSRAISTTSNRYPGRSEARSTASCFLQSFHLFEEPGPDTAGDTGDPGRRWIHAGRKNPADPTCG